MSYDLIIGLVRGAHGVAGELRVEPITDQPERFRRLKQVWVEPRSGDGGLRKIESCRLTAQGVLLKLKDLDNREDARALTGAYLKVKTSAAIKLPEDHYFHFHIIGLRVQTTTGEDLGEVMEVLSLPANDVYVTLRANIPALKQFVREVDLKRGVMIVDLPEEV